jgi:polar amino acid transport system substrate-binding protein
VVSLPDNATAMAAVRSGRVSAYAGTALTIARLAESSADVEAADPFRGPRIDGRETAGYGAFGFRQDDRGFRDRFNTELEGFLGTEEWRELVRPYGFGDHTLPDKTAEELCRDAAEVP